jgi:hypothetical protein
MSSPTPTTTGKAKRVSLVSLPPLAVLFLTFFLPFCQDSTLREPSRPLVPFAYGLEHAGELRSIASLPVFVLPLVLIAVVALALLRRGEPRSGEALLATVCLLLMPVAELAEIGSRLVRSPSDYPTLMFFVPALVGLYLLRTSRKADGWDRWRRITTAYLAFALSAPSTSDAIIWNHSLLIGGHLYLLSLGVLLLVLGWSFVGAQ